MKFWPWQVDNCLVSADDGKRTFVVVDEWSQRLSPDGADEIAGKVRSLLNGSLRHLWMTHWKIFIRKLQAGIADGVYIIAVFHLIKLVNEQSFSFSITF